MNNQTDLSHADIRSLRSEVRALRKECASNRELSNLLLGIIVERAGLFDEQTPEPSADTGFSHTWLCPSRLP